MSGRGNADGEARKWRRPLIATLVVVALQMCYVTTTRIWPVRDVVHDGVRYTLTRGCGKSDWIPFLGLLGFDFVMKGVKDRAVLTKTTLSSGESVSKRIEWLGNVYEEYPFLRQQ